MGSTGFEKTFKAVIAVTNNAKLAVTDKNINVDNHNPGGTTSSRIFPVEVCLLADIFPGKLSTTDRPLFNGVQSRRVCPVRIRCSSSLRNSSDPWQL